MADRTPGAMGGDEQSIQVSLVLSDGAPHRLGGDVTINESGPSCETTVDQKLSPDQVVDGRIELPAAVQSIDHRPTCGQQFTIAYSGATIDGVTFAPDTWTLPPAPTTTVETFSQVSS
ncbi:MAG: hypothetical protein JWM85_1804 [Acidimicrobiaceae bacterium]|nr:hypothetical protein [Acidimicrobiaceae bacterium]